MSLTINYSDKKHFLPPSIASSIKKSLWILIGIIILATAILSTLSLLSYNSNDPSLNTSENIIVKNWLSAPGAIFADSALQAFGIAIIFPILFTYSIGYKFIRYQNVNWLWLRILSAALCPFLIATGLALFSWSKDSFLPSGLGGYSGSLIFSSIKELLIIYSEYNLLFLWIITISSLFLGLIIFQWSSFISLNSYFKVYNFIDQIIAFIFEYLNRCYKFFAYLFRIKKNKNLDLLLEKGNIKTENYYETIDSDKKYQNLKRDIVLPKNNFTQQSKKEFQSRQKSFLSNSIAGFKLPPLDILSMIRVQLNSQVDTKSLEINAKILENVLKDFGINGNITKVRPGPIVTLYELDPAPGTKTSRVVALADDIARSMSALSVRIAVVPGRTVIGIELPNERRDIVYLREMFSAAEWDTFDGNLPLALGKSINGAPIFADLTRMPHLLIAGTTGSGKSVAINTMVMSILYRHSPVDVRLLLIDPKMLELSIYEGIPHLLAPVVTDASKAVVALKWVVREMEERYKSMSQLSVRNIAGYNQRLNDALQKGKVLTKNVQVGFDSETGRPIFEEEELDLTPLPYIVVIIDEMADLMLVAGKDVEAAVQRLAQMARAAGIHVIMATQRPSVDVITGTIKANFPTRISFQVTSKVDSRTILGEQGAEQLLGQGDMLHMAAGGRITRIHSPYISVEEVERVVMHLREQGGPSYLDSVTDENINDMSNVPGFGTSLVGGNSEIDSLFDTAVSLVAHERKASTSFIQRQLKIGYNRAATIIEAMEAQGIVGKANHVGKREVLIPEQRD